MMKVRISAQRCVHQRSYSVNESTSSYTSSWLSTEMTVRGYTVFAFNRLLDDSTNLAIPLLVGAIIYCRWFHGHRQGKNGEFCVTATIVGQKRWLLKESAMRPTYRPIRVVAELGFTFIGSKRRKWDELKHDGSVWSTRILLKLTVSIFRRYMQCTRRTRPR